MTVVISPETGDYTIENATLQFGPSTAEHCFQFQALQDTVIEDNEVVMLAIQLVTDLGAGSGSATLLPNTTSVTIVDDDGRLNTCMCIVYAIQFWKAMDIVLKKCCINSKCTHYIPSIMQSSVDTYVHF